MKTRVLKTYHFVKEFGEGFYRICREQEANGANVPSFRTDEFILKITVPKVSENVNVNVTENDGKVAENVTENDGKVAENVTENDGKVAENVTEKFTEKPKSSQKIIEILLISPKNGENLGKC